MFSRRPGALRRWGGASTPRRSKREARRRLRHLLLGARGTNMAAMSGHVTDSYLEFPGC